MPDPRNNAADAQAAFESMSDGEWASLWASPGVPYGLTPAEQEGLAAAMVTRIQRRRAGSDVLGRLLERD